MVLFILKNWKLILGGIGIILFLCMIIYIQSLKSDVKDLLNRVVELEKVITTQQESNKELNEQLGICVVDNNRLNNYYDEQQEIVNKKDSELKKIENLVNKLKKSSGNCVKKMDKETNKKFIDLYNELIGGIE